MENFKYNIPGRIGGIAFIAMIIMGMMSYVFYETMFKSLMMTIVIGLFGLGLLIFLAIWSGINYRRANGNYITLGHAFLASYIVLMCASFGNVVSVTLINKVIDKQYAQKASAILIDQTKERMEKYNVPDDKAAEAIKDMGPEKFDPPLLRQLTTLGYSAVGWAVVSLIIAAFIKRGSDDIRPLDTIIDDQKLTRSDQF